MIIPCVWERKAQVKNVFLTDILCALTQACFDMDFDVTFLAPCWAWEMTPKHIFLCGKGLQKNSHSGPFGNPLLWVVRKSNRFGPSLDQKDIDMVKVCGPDSDPSDHIWNHQNSSQGFKTLIWNCQTRVNMDLRRPFHGFSPSCRSDSNFIWAFRHEDGDSSLLTQMWVWMLNFQDNSVFLSVIMTDKQAAQLTDNQFGGVPNELQSLWHPSLSCHWSQDFVLSHHMISTTSTCDPQRKQRQFWNETIVSSILPAWCQLMHMATGIVDEDSASLMCSLTWLFQWDPKKLGHFSWIMELDGLVFSAVQTVCELFLRFWGCSCERWSEKGPWLLSIANGWAWASQRLHLAILLAVVWCCLMLLCVSSSIEFKVLVLRGMQHCSRCSAGSASAGCSKWENSSWGTDAPGKASMKCSEQMRRSSRPSLSGLFSSGWHPTIRTSVVSLVCGCRTKSYLTGLKNGWKTRKRRRRGASIGAPNGQKCTSYSFTYRWNSVLNNAFGEWPNCISKHMAKNICHGLTAAEFQPASFFLGNATYLGQWLLKKFAMRRGAHLFRAESTTSGQSSHLQSGHPQLFHRSNLFFAFVWAVRDSSGLRVFSTKCISSHLRGIRV